MKRTTGPKPLSAYAQAGVDIDEKMKGLSAIRTLVRSTQTSPAVNPAGSFGGLYASPGAGEYLVASTDGVGTKLKVAVMAGVHDTVGQCLVNHCVNDILVQGARPLFFLDYVGAARLSSTVFRSILSGICKACRANGCAVLGGETAELPGLYPAQEYDLVGTIVGSVHRRRLVTGERIREGDALVALPSSGLHTNGYSLARRVLFDLCGLGIRDPFPGLKQSVAQVLLRVHRSYLRPVSALLDAGMPVHGMAHITGGGLVDNIPRVLPAGLDAAIDLGSWRTPPLFGMLCERGNVDVAERYRVFNMGVGFVLVVPRRALEQTLAVLKAQRAGPWVIGRVQAGRKVVTFEGAPRA